MAEGRVTYPYADKNQLSKIPGPTSDGNAGVDSGSDMSYDFIGLRSSFTELPLRVPKRHKVVIKRKPLLQIHPDGSSDSDFDSDCDSNKPSTIFSDDSQHFYGTHAPSPKSLELEGQVVPVELPYNHELGLEPVLIESQDEVFLQQLCYLPTGIKRLLVDPDGGTFILGSGDAILEFPPGAVAKETSIRYAIILHGSFLITNGYKLCSIVVYINMDGITLVKPVYLILSHWCIREEGDDEGTLKFIRASHTLEAGQQMYMFEALQEGDFASYSNLGILRISQPQCLYCVATKAEAVARYRAVTFVWYIASKESLLFRIVFMCDSLEWNQKVTMSMEQQGWQKSYNIVPQFQYSAERLRVSTSRSSGPGWLACIEGTNDICEADFLQPRGKSKADLEMEVTSGRFPPSIAYKIIYTSPEEKRVSPTFLKIDVHGANVPLTFSCMLREEPLELPSSVSETGGSGEDNTSSQTVNDNKLHKLQEQYSEVVRNQASVTLKITKCTTIGPPRMGKTCLKNLLIGQEWDMEAGTASTDVMEAPNWVQCYSFEDERSEKPWKLLSEDQLQCQWLRYVNTLTSRKTEMTTSPGDPSPTTTPSNVQQPSRLTSAHPPPTKLDTAQMSATFPQASAGAFSKENLQNFLKDKQGKVLGETRLVHFIDTGGQAIYHDVHPVLITSPSVYLVVFSLSELCKKSLEERIAYFRSGLIQRPLRSIYTFGKKAPQKEDYVVLRSKAPKILVVGTHLDQVPLEGSDMEHFLDDISRMIEKEISSKPYRQFVKYDTNIRSFWAVDNTLAGKKQSEDVRKYNTGLRRIVQEGSTEMSVKVPLPWMLMKFVMNSMGVPYCKYSQILEEACSRDCVREEADLDTMLWLFHILGLIYHKVPSEYKKEDSLVFIDPDCLYSATSDFLMAAKEEIEESSETQHQTLAASREETEEGQGGSKETQHQTLTASREEAEEGQGGSKEAQHQTQAPSREEIRSRQHSQEPNRIVQKNRVMKRIQCNSESIKSAIEAELQTAEQAMKQEANEDMLTLLHNQLKKIEQQYKLPTREIQDAASVKAKQQLYICRMVKSLASSVKTMLGDAGGKRDVYRVRREVGMAVESIRKHYQSRSIDSHDMDQFLAILSDLRIVAKLSDSDIYVIPAALPKVPLIFNITGSADPILVTVVPEAIKQVCFLPSGLFCCLISELVTGLRWTIKPLGRTHVAFTHKDLTGEVHIVEHEAYFEIKLKSHAPLEELSATCHNVREEIHRSIVHLYKTLYSDPTDATMFEESLLWGFRCGEHPGDDTHIAAFGIADDECWTECLLEPSNVLDVEPEQLVWFNC